MKQNSAFPGLLFITVYTLFCLAVIFFFVRGVGVIAGLFFGSRGVIAAALSQLANARVSVPFWIPLCGAAAVSVPRALYAKRFGGEKAAAVTALSFVILLFAFAAAFFLTKVNGVFVHVAIGIIGTLLESGAF